jgi:hypothetical protein
MSKQSIKGCTKMGYGRDIRPNGIVIMNIYIMIHPAQRTAITTTFLLQSSSQVKAKVSQRKDIRKDNRIAECVTHMKLQSQWHQDEVRGCSAPISLGTGTAERWTDVGPAPALRSTGAGTCETQIPFFPLQPRIFTFHTTVGAVA